MSGDLTKTLLARATSYGRDADVLHHDGDTHNAAVYRAIADELRKLADEDWPPAPELDSRMTDELLRGIYPGEPSPGVRVKHAGRWWTVGEQNPGDKSWAVTS